MTRAYESEIRPPLRRRGPRGAERTATHLWAIPWCGAPGVKVFVHVLAPGRSCGWWTLDRWLAYGEAAP